MAGTYSTGTPSFCDRCFASASNFSFSSVEFWSGMAEKRRAVFFAGWLVDVAVAGELLVPEVLLSQAETRNSGSSIARRGTRWRVGAGS